MILYIKYFYLIHFFDSNIMKIEQGMGFEFLLLIATLFEAVCSIIICFVVSWQLTLILLCLMPFVIGASSVFSKV